MTHNGKIVLRSGTHIPLTYELTPPAADGLCHGKLLGELEQIDPTLSPERLRLVCADGLTVDLLITHYSARGATFVGTISHNGNHAEELVERAGVECAP
ncbi:hypothetical protein [Bosea sp. BK604]|uniref:hypothetical protein n=1 Tax=Bosea sp. BK604 TaxID=2512180 RepID=UPI001053959F|nr:hypothetical protein [Bosea sp. BK604]TCR67573.1 hypothetical protein EV560_103636 [Bosea sp. BK604]